MRVGDGTPCIANYKDTFIEEAKNKIKEFALEKSEMISTLEYVIKNIEDSYIGKEKSFELMNKMLKKLKSK